MSIYIIDSFYGAFYDPRIIFGKRKIVILKGTYIQVLIIGLHIAILVGYIFKQTPTPLTKG